MKYYETLFIVHPALEAGRLKDNIVLMQETLEKHGGKIITIDFWGKKILAYFIEKQRYGTYVLFQFNAEGKCLKEFSLEMEHNPNVLAYMTTKINKNEIIENNEVLDSQIAGKSRDSDSKKLDKKEETEKTSNTSEASETESSEAAAEDHKTESNLKE